MTNKINFTQAVLDKLPNAPKSKRVMYYDNKCPHLAVRVSDTGSKSFIVQTRFKGRVIKITLGKYPEMKIDRARTLYIETLGKLSNGINPNEEKKSAREEYTLKDLYEEYMTRYSRPYKKSWKYDEREIPLFLSKWFNRKLSDISNQDVRYLHDMTRSTNGLYQANRILERLRAMYNKAIEWGYAKDNPTNNIKKFKEVKRDRYLKPAEVKSFFASLEMEENPVAKNYFKILLFTGARKTNVLMMRWEEIDFELKTWRIPDTKNGEPLDVPLIPMVMEILESMPRDSEWVFPSATSKDGHFADPKRPWKRILERADIEDLRIHDIRRTLGSYQAITGTSLNIIGKSLGHKSIEATKIYARLSNDPVRDSMEKAVNKIFEYNGDVDE